jgi:hypothetical protein
VGAFASRGLLHRGWATTNRNQDWHNRSRREECHTPASRYPKLQPGFTLALLVFWSRLYLRRYDLRETLVGTFLGLLGGLVTAW